MAGISEPGEVLEGEVVSGEVVERILRGEVVELEVQDPEVVRRQIAERILSSESVEAALEQRKTTKAADIVGVPVVARGVTWMKSAFDDEDQSGPGAYAILDAFNPADGEALVVTTGALNVLAALRVIERAGGFPEPIVFVAGKAAAGKSAPMWLESPQGVTREALLNSLPDAV